MFDEFNNLFMNNSNSQADNLTKKTFTEMAIDFNTGEIIVDENTNDIKILKENEALKVWIWKALKTKRNFYEAYSSSFGSDLHKEIGYVYDRTIKEQLINNEIMETLLVNPYIKRVYNFVNEYDNDNLKLTVYFSVDTIYGTIGENEVSLNNV